MSGIFRVRPANDLSVEEIEKGYLWFSRPTSFNDVEDARVFAFVEQNEPIKNAFARLYKDNIDVATESALAGICCFTREMPSSNQLRSFPSATFGLVIEYDRAVLEAHFIQKHALGDCFKKVEYLRHPILFGSSSHSDIAWKYIGNDIVYKPMALITGDLKLMDQLFLKMFTRINARYKRQKELRIILAGRNIPNREPGLRGYQVPVPREAIKKIHLHARAPGRIRQRLEGLGVPYVIFGNTRKGHGASAA